jgi:diguanylate cyclase (GGDEF)-like protein
LIIPILVFGAYRFSVAGSSTIALLLSAAVFYGTFESILRFSDTAKAYQSTPSVSLFLFVSVSISLILSAAIAERKQAEKELERIAHYDALTNLPNRVLLASRLNKAMAKCHRNKRSLVVALMDLDDFKAINDEYGHDVGDDLLIKVSKRMQGALFEGDMVARIGGDEFIVLMTNLKSIDDSKPVLARLLKAAADPVTLGDAVVQVSMSIGVTLYPQDAVDADHLIRHADQAMCVAKQSGKNGYHLFDIAQNNAGQIQVKIISDISNALDRNEFLLHYQPKVNMRSGEVIGVEALIRWQHPERGLVPPLEFLPAIEGHEISLRVGEWVISTALSQISHWRSMGLQIPISVNVSAYQLQQLSFTRCLINMLAVHPSVSPQYLELEILETSELKNTLEVSQTMKACQMLGVRFALDDFGTGYSSLTYLKLLPASTIKIDQSFVRDMLEDNEDFAIVEGVVGLAKAFRRDVIAEGVETVAHGLALLELGCELAQGFGIARPMPGDDIREWIISSWKADDSWQDGKGFKVSLKVLDKSLDS